MTRTAEPAASVPSTTTQPTAAAASTTQTVTIAAPSTNERSADEAVTGASSDTAAAAAAAPQVPATLAADADAIAAEDAAATGFFADISKWLAPLNRVQLNYGVSVTDVDGDHVFEAFVCGYGFANTLIAWRDGAARDLAPSLGIAAPSRKAIGVASCDMDADGKEEIYVLNTDSYGGSKRYTDHLFRHGSAAGDTWVDLLDSDVNAASRSSFAGAACHIR